MSHTARPRPLVSEEQFVAVQTVQYAPVPATGSTRT